MKKNLIVVMFLLLCSTAVYASPFSPAVLNLSAPAFILYNFDGTQLSIPVTVTGTPAYTLFLVYTKDKAESIVNIQNGYLGWHYVNKIDTCIYASTGAELKKGANTILWNGTDKTGKPVSPGDYTYYLWAYDHISPRQVAIQKLTFGVDSNFIIQDKDQSGNILAQPIMRGMFKRWTLGSDPQDSSLIETTKATFPTGWTGGGYGPSALDPADNTLFYISVANKESQIQGISKYQWVPNGEAILQSAWGENGYSLYNAFLDAEPGVVTDGQYLYSGDSNHHLVDAMSTFYMFDFDGSIIKTVDLTKWWSNPEELAAGGQMNGGPTIYHERNGYIFLNCHCSCIKQMVNPLAEDETDFFVWTNENGDYTLDHNFAQDASKKWVCNDFNVGPYNYNIQADTNLFSICPAFDMGAVSFALMGPDGTGLSYFSFSGETAQQKYGNVICDSNSAYDGIYTTVNQSDVAGISPGIWHVGHDSIKGVISSQVGVADAAPSAFTVAQNSPNPFNPTTTISFNLAKSGKTTVEVYNVAGQKVDTLVNGVMSAGVHSTVWNAARFSAGVYFYNVKCGNFSKTMKMTLLK